jgi:GNAT superfamily N-acetyltransferase
MLTFRPARVADLSELEALQSRASFATGENVDDLFAHPDAMTIPVEHLAYALVAEINGEIVGFCILLPTSSDAAEVDALFIDPKAWRTGLGRALLLRAEQDLTNQTRTLRVVSGKRAVPFYQALGFQRAGTEMTRFGPAARLVKMLSPAGSPPI